MLRVLILIAVITVSDYTVEIFSVIKFVLIKNELVFIT